VDIINMKSTAKNFNDLTYQDYFYKLKMLAMARFEWDELPNGIDEKWIERFLFEDGHCVFFIDDLRGPMVAKCTLEGVNSYGEPTSIVPVGVDIESRRLTPGEDCVLIQNNDERIPTSRFIQLFAYRLAQTTRAIDVNVNAQKTPILILGTDKQKLSLKNLYAQYTGNEPVIFGDKGIDTEVMKVLNTQAPVVFPQLHEHKQNIWNECLTFLGINNANTDKRERLIKDEVEANNTHIDLSAECFLKSRENAVEQINKLFGEHIEVKVRGTADEKLIEDEKEVDEECMQDTQKSSET
jgi:hypothetical protein